MTGFLQSSSNKRSCSQIQCGSSTYNPVGSDPYDNRNKRRKYMAQKRLAHEAARVVTQESIHCGRFPQEYIDALKGIV
ncbi:hypothetical protein PVAP13_1NG283319 [Panicum virgatum]|uniref:Uncharacterized protein n=1 Tax=Panicum virgatum TaxID=38727 RepID=A0A8T0X228_PANVG|nr:hypothetical protein PVAP13_1NG283319 [Panicum virgatum]